MISKEDFIRYFSYIEIYLNESNKVVEALSTIFTSSYISAPEYTHELLDAYIEVLERLCEDTKYHWIEYYVWECDMGKNKNKVELKEGLNVKKYTLNSVIKLYQLLVDSNNPF